MLFGLPHWGTLEKNMTRKEFEQKTQKYGIIMLAEVYYGCRGSKRKSHELFHSS